MMDHLTLCDYERRLVLLLLPALYLNVSPAHGTNDYSHRIVIQKSYH